MRGIFVASLGCLLALYSALPLSSTKAEESYSDRPAIKLSVRAIQASGAEASLTESGSESEKLKKPHIESQLTDIEEKLTQLPFSHFHLISKEEKTVHARARESIPLPRGQVLTVRPIYMDTDSAKICLYIHWQDRDGSHILDTRVHFDSRESVITGTDSSQNEGLILAIRAEAAN